MDFDFLKTAFVTLFVAVDPPGLAPIFLGLTSSMSAAARAQTARRSVVIAFMILFGVAIAGQPVLEMLGIGIPAFRIAGGLLLFYIAFEMVFEKREERKAHSTEEALQQDQFKHDVAAFPLAIPLMAGPSAITATILQASNAQGNFFNFGGLMFIIALVIGSCYFVFRLALQIDRFLGASGRAVLSRLLGVLLAAMAIQIIGDGAVAFID